jgi:hypothetical protein
MIYFKNFVTYLSNDGPKSKGSCFDLLAKELHVRRTIVNLCEPFQALPTYSTWILYNQVELDSMPCLHLSSILPIVEVLDVPFLQIKWFLLVIVD